MEELEVDNELVRLQEEEDRKKRNGKKKKPAPLMRQRTESEIREELGINDIDVFCKSFGVVVFVFSIMASIGGLMQLASSSNNKIIATHAIEQQELNVNVAREVFVLACQTTWIATQLWAKLLVAILLPTSHQTFIFTKDGFSAMQPSIRASWTFLINLHWTTKVAIAAGILALVAAILLQREIRRRRYVERIQEYYTQRANAVQSSYDAFVNEVRRESRILADLLPHFLFVGASGALLLLFRNQFIDFSRGLGGWAMVIGLPALFSMRALVVYDIAYRKKVEKFLGQRRRTLSHFPTPESPEMQQLNLVDTARSYLTSWFSSPPKRSEKKRADSQEDDSSSVGSLDSTEVNTVDGIKYPRQLENDPDASLEQYDELQSVIYWLQYWSVLGLALLVEQLPITGHMVSIIPIWPPVRVLWALWLQLPGTAGAALAFKLVVPLINTYLGEVSGPTVSIEQQNLLANVLFAFRLISAENRVKLAELLQTGGTVLLVALPFFILPGFFTGIGAVVIGVGRPVLSGTRVIVAVERARRITEFAAQSKDTSSMKRFRSNSVSISNGAVQATQWLEYWIVYLVIMLVNGILNVFLFWFPFYQHIILGVTLWLQLPYFRGAHNIFKLALKIIYKVRALFVTDSISESMKREKSEKSEKSRDLPRVDEEENSDSGSVRSKRTSKKRASKRSSAARQDDPAWYEKLFKSPSQNSQGESAESSRATHGGSFLSLSSFTRMSVGSTKRSVVEEPSEVPSEVPLHHDDEDLYDPGSNPRGGEMEFEESPLSPSRSSSSRTKKGRKSSKGRHSAIADESQADGEEEEDEEIRRLRRELEKAEKRLKEKKLDHHHVDDPSTDTEESVGLADIAEPLSKEDFDWEVADDVDGDDAEDEEPSSSSGNNTPRSSSQRKKKSKKNKKRRSGKKSEPVEEEPKKEAEQSTKNSKKGGILSFWY